MENVPGGNVLIMKFWSRGRLISLRDLSIAPAVGPSQPPFSKGQDARVVHVLSHRMVRCVTGNTDCFDSFAVCNNNAASQIEKDNITYQRVVLHIMWQCLFCCLNPVSSNIYIYICISFFFSRPWHFDRLQWLNGNHNTSKCSSLLSRS